MKIPFLPLHIAKSSTVQAQHEKIEAYETILAGCVPALEQVCLALHELKAGGNGATRRKRGRDLDRRIRKLSEMIAVYIGGEDDLA